MKSIITRVFFLLLSISLTAQTVSTVTEGTITDGLGIDNQGNIYGSEFGGDTVFKFDPQTEEVTVFATGFINPNGITVNAQGEIFICDHAIGGEGIIYKYDQLGNVIDTFGGLTTPSGIQPIPGTEDLLFVEYNTSTINRLAADGTTTQLFSGTPINGPAGIVFIDGDAYIANFNDRQVYHFDLQTNTPTFLAQLPSIGPPNLDFLGFLSAKDGLLIATHLGGHQLFRIDPETGTVTSFAGSTAGGTDGDLGMATFNLPNGILGDDSSNRIYVSDAGTSNLRIIDEATLSVDAFAKAIVDLSIFPNPTKDTINIQLRLPVLEKYTLSIYDLQGKQLFMKEAMPAQMQLEEVITTENWRSGTYIVHLTFGETIITQKLIK